VCQNFGTHYDACIFIENQRQFLGAILTKPVELETAQKFVARGVSAHGAAAIKPICGIDSKKSSLVKVSEGCGAVWVRALG
jgi:predicted methyltransferase